MALRYLLLVRKAAQHGPTLRPTIEPPAELVRLFETQAISLFASNAAPWRRLPGGVAIGHVFRSDDAGSARAHAGSSLPGNAGASLDLLRDCWGAYVACSDTPDGVEILRDPSGQLPCYHGGNDAVTAFASDLDLLVATGIVAPVIDREQLSRSLFLPDLLETRTAIVGVKELLPGTAIRIDDAGMRSLVRWAPWDHVSAPPPTPEALRTVVKTCVATWSSCFDRIRIGVSGGLDSSIVAAALASREAAGALTISTSDAHGDERHYARILCARLGLPLTEADYDLAAIDIARSSIAHRPRPGGRAQLQAYDAVVERMMRGDQADAFFTGVGGDNVFQFTRSARPVADRLRVEGPGRGVATTFADVGRLTGASHWAVFRHSLRLLGAATRATWQGDPRYLTDDCIRAGTHCAPDHPWLDHPFGALPGKIGHIAMLVRAQTYMDVHDRRQPFTTLHPLLSQPIMEACLAVPSWRACSGGRDRAFAREAFARDLPAALINRRSKGGPDSFAHAILRTNLQRVRATLLDGYLAREGIICRVALEAGLSERAIARGDDYVRLLLLLDTEAWVRHWRGGRGRNSD